MRRAALVLAAVAVLGTTACSDDKTSWEPGAPGSPAPADPPEELKYDGPIPAFTRNPDGTANRGGAAQPSTTEAQLNAGGLGPYKIGAALKELQGASQVTGVKAADGCADYMHAKGTSKYHSPDLVFFQGRLLYLTIDSSSVKTDKGVKIGTTLANLKGNYPDGKEITDYSGATAWIATTGDYALLFPLGKDKVRGVQAGMAEPMQFKYTDNQGC